LDGIIPVPSLREMRWGVGTVAGHGHTVARGAVPGMIAATSEYRSRARRGNESAPRRADEPCRSRSPPPRLRLTRQTLGCASRQRRGDSEEAIRLPIPLARSPGSPAGRNRNETSVRCRILHLAAGREPVCGASLAESGAPQDPRDRETGATRSAAGPGSVGYTRESAADVTDDFFVDRRSEPSESARACMFHSLSDPQIPEPF
jgi:hypothetical protein